jgi:hypothetical protein
MPIVISLGIWWCGSALCGAVLLGVLGSFGVVPSLVRQWAGEVMMPGEMVLYCFFNGEFDPGSGRTLAACLTHASRTVKPFGVDQWRTGE